MANIESPLFLPDPIVRGYAEPFLLFSNIEVEGDEFQGVHYLKRQENARKILLTARTGTLLHPLEARFPFIDPVFNDIFPQESVDDVIEPPVIPGRAPVILTLTNSSATKFLKTHALDLTFTRKNDILVPDEHSAIYRIPLEAIRTKRIEDASYTYGFQRVQPDGTVLPDEPQHALAVPHNIGFLSTIQAQIVPLAA